MGFLNDIEPLKQTALTELKAAPDLAALEQTKGAWIGPNGKFTALMKQLGTLSKEEKPAAGKLINAAARTAGITYSRLIEGLIAAKCELDRKIISDLAATDNAAFLEIINIAKNALKNKPGAVLAKA